ncbi:MAG: ABC transporter substrate-binding protein [Deltaproteobacteria bacterium]|nr:ABC transporter substrate-binding protein [Deltaproteobacteria bacterium]
MDRNVMRLSAFFVLLGLGYEVHAAQEAITKIRISQSSVTSTATPFWIAQEQGMFKKYKLEVEAIYVRNSTIQMAGLSTGSFQLSSTGGTPSLSAAAGGLSLKILASMGRRLPYDIAVRPDIKAPEDLRGKNLGVTNIGGTTWMAAILALEHLRLDPARDDIKLQALGNQTVLVQALERGRIEVILIDHFFNRQLKEKGFSILLEGPLANIPFASNGLVASRGYLEQHPNIVESALKALLEAQAFIANPGNKPVVLKTIREHLKVADPSVAEWGYQYLIEMLERKPYPALEGVRNIQRLMRHNPQVAKIRAEDVVDDRIMRKLDESGFIDSLYSSTDAK